MASSSCPTLTLIDADTQQRAATELEGLGPDSAVGKVLAASSADRDKIRECRRLEKRWSAWR